MKKWKLCAAILMLIAILLQPQAAVDGAQSAMRMWATSVAPALFPFLAMLPVLAGKEACEAYRHMFARLMGGLGLPPQGAPAILIGMISGSPGGALAIKRIAAQSGMPKADACRITLAVSGLSPAYLILGVGQGLFGSPALGARLAMLQAAIQIAMLFLLRGAFDDKAGVVPAAPDAQMRGAIGCAVENVLAICGYMVLFSAASAVLSQWIGRDAGRILLLAADLPSGVAQLAAWDLPGKMFLLGGALGFGGLCIAAQNLHALRDADVHTAEYLAAKGISAALFAMIAGVLHAPERVQSQSLPSALTGYAFSMLAALLLALPVLIYFSNTLFLNKQKSAPDKAESKRNANIW